MKKLSMVLASLLAASTMAWAANDLAWFVNWGVYTHDATDLVTQESGAILDSYSVLWQLISAGTNNVIDAVDITNPDYVSNDDVVLDYRNVSKGDAMFDEYLFLREGVTYDNTYCDPKIPYEYSEENPYYVYQRIFESQSPEVGTHYYESELVKLDATYASSSQLFGLGPEESGIQANLVVQGSSVPEPATLSLMGLGALAMVLRRKLRK